MPPRIRKNMLSLSQIESRDSVEQIPLMHEFSKRIFVFSLFLAMPHLDAVSLWSISNCHVMAFVFYFFSFWVGWNTTALTDQHTHEDNKSYANGKYLNSMSSMRSNCFKSNHLEQSHHSVWFLSVTHFFHIFFSSFSLEIEMMECPVCLQICVHPSKLPCGHIFCFLCVKVISILAIFSLNFKCIVFIVW